jgi:uncharacterized OB-fold protein
MAIKTPSEKGAEMKTCKKCGGPRLGSQRYCPPCWQKYLKERKEMRRLDMIYTFYPHLRPKDFPLVP